MAWPMPGLSGFGRSHCPDIGEIRAGCHMILLYHPRATKPRNRKFPLSVLALAAVLEGREDYAIIDGNVDGNATETLFSLMRAESVELLAVAVMPGPQMVAAMETCRQ